MSRLVVGSASHEGQNREDAESEDHEEHHRQQAILLVIMVFLLQGLGETGLSGAVCSCRSAGVRSLSACVGFHRPNAT